MKMIEDQGASRDLRSNGNAATVSLSFAGAPAGQSEAERTYARWRLEMERRKAIYEALSWALRVPGDVGTRIDMATDRLMNELFPAQPPVQQKASSSPG